VSGLGPRPGSSERTLSPSRRAILETLRGQPEPLTQSAIEALTQLHENTVREHLIGLVRAGLAHRYAAEPSGRGRPAWLYVATDDPGASEYAALASALASTIARTSSNVHDDALEAGLSWAEELLNERAAQARTPEQARAHVVLLLDDLGFEPRQDEEHPAEVDLTRCPLLAAAHRHPEVVCAVHLGLVRGALQQFGVDPGGSDLVPFAGPGTCRLLVPPLGN